MLTFLHISDTHISSDPAYRPPLTAEWVRHPNRGVEALLEAIQQLTFPIDFILHTGDVCADPSSDDAHCARELLLRFPQPFLFLAGNHDSAEFLRQHLHDGAQFHLLADSQWSCKGYRLLTLDTKGVGDVHAPLLSDEQIAAFAERLDAVDDQPTIVAAHHPLIETGVAWIDDSMRVQNGERIQRLLAGHSGHIAGYFHGHIHQAMDTVRDGVAHISCQSTWSNLAGYPGMERPQPDPLTPAGFNLVMVRGKSSFIRRYSLPRLD